MFPRKVSGCENGALPGSLRPPPPGRFPISVARAQQLSGPLTRRQHGLRPRWRNSEKPTGSSRQAEGQSPALCSTQTWRLPPSPGGRPRGPLCCSGACTGDHAQPCPGLPPRRVHTGPAAQTCVAPCPELHGPVYTVPGGGGGWGRPGFLWGTLEDFEVQPPFLLWGVAGGNRRLCFVGFRRHRSP